MAGFHYGFEKRLPGVSFESAIEKTTAALSREGFGVLMQTDVKDTLKKKLNVEFRDYLILGACNPTLANQALSKDLEVGLLLPCNVCLWSEDGGVRVAVVRPDALFTLVGEPAVEPIARQVDGKLRRALDAVS